MCVHWLLLMALALTVLSEQKSGEAAKPDFSGRWKLNLAASKLEIPPPTSSRFEIEHREPKFRLTRTHVYGERSDTVTVELTTDGMKTEQVFGDRRATICAHWEGSVLVAEMHVRTKDDEGTNVVRYSLANSGKQLVAVERWRSAKGRYHNTWVLDRE
jgi:hypothetical protein